MANRAMNWRASKTAHFSKGEYDTTKITGIVMKNVLVKGQGEASQPRYTACLFHRNPPFCTACLIGLSFLYRFSVMEEKLPNLQDPTSWHHLPVLRAVRTVQGCVKNMSEDSLSETTRRMLQLAQVELITNDAITHIGRHQSQVEAQKARVPEPDINRACNYNIGEREKHYSVVTPLSWQYQRSMYRHEDPEEEAAHIRAVKEKLKEVDAIINRMVTGMTSLEHNLSALAREIAQMPLKDQAKARKDKKLRSCRNLVSFLRWTMRGAIGLLASRDRCEDGNINHNSPPAFKKHAMSPLVGGLRLGESRLIDHPDFLLFAQHVSKLEVADDDELGSPRTRKQAKASAIATHKLIQPQLDVACKAAASAAHVSQEMMRVIEHNGLELPLPPYKPPDGTRPLLDGGWIKVTQAGSSIQKTPKTSVPLPLKNVTSVVLGLDPSQSCGWARLMISARGVLEQVVVGVIDVSDQANDGLKCAKLQSSLDVLTFPKPDKVCTERYYGHGFQSDTINLKLRGVIDMYMESHGISHSTVAPQTWKKTSCQQGNANKKEVRAAIELSLNTTFPEQVMINGTLGAFRDDVSDAVGIALHAAGELVSSIHPGLRIETVQPTIPSLPSSSSTPKPVEDLPIATTLPKKPNTIAMAVESTPTYKEEDVMTAVDGVVRAIAAAVGHTTPDMSSLICKKLQGMSNGMGAETLSQRVMKRGLELATSTLGIDAGVDHETSKRRCRQTDLAVRGEVTLKTVSEHGDSVASLWNYWKQIVWPMEMKGNAWRTKNATVNREYNHQLFFIREVARLCELYGEEQALQRVQTRLREMTSWSKLHRQLETEQPSSGRGEGNAIVKKVLSL